jgi:hypothetical protein
MLALCRLYGLFRHAGRVTLGGGLVGIATNIVGGVALFKDLEVSGWQLIAFGTGVLALTFLSVAYQAAKERDEKESAPSGISTSTTGDNSPIIIAGGSVTYASNSPRQIHRPENFDQRTIEGSPDDYAKVYVWELLEKVPGQPDSIINRTLRYVELCGPALLAVVPGSTFDAVAFGMLDNDFESILWTPGSARSVLGPVVLQNTQLENCRTESIAFTGSPNVVNQLRQEFRALG